MSNVFTAQHEPAVPWHQAALGKDSMRYLANYFAIQSIVVAVFVAAFYWSWGFDLPKRLLVAFLPAQFVCTLLIYRLALTMTTVKTWHYLLMLMLSVLMLAWFLHDSGGHTNPLISLLLVPLAMSAAMLGWQASACLALLVLMIYGGLMNFFMPLQESHPAGHHHGDNQMMMQLHLLGMWLTFCLSVLLIMVFVIPLANSIRKQRELIARQREQSLQDERIVAMATFAASAAHQLGTPLSTLSVIADDLADEFKDNDNVQQDIQVMAEQIALCKSTLHSMMRRADAIRNQEYAVVAMADFLQSIRKQFNLLNPAFSLQLPAENQADLSIRSDETLEQAVLNLLDNAVRAGNASPLIEVSSNSEEVCLKVIDSGPGIADSVQRNIGQPFISTRDKNDGLGLGLFLSNSTINRLGGRLKLTPGEQGTVTEVWLPRVEGHHG